MNRLKHILAMMTGSLSLLVSSCIHEFPVTDYSFEFSARVVYDEDNNQHRLTLTKVLGACEDDYRVVFNLDGEASVGLTDMNGRTHEGVMNENFKDISTRTYTLTKMDPGNHVLHLDIETDHYSQSLEVPFIVEDFSFLFEYRILFDEDTKAHSLEINLKEGSTADRYNVSYTIDNTEPMKTFSEDFSKNLSRTYALAQAEPGDHTINLMISTDRHTQKADIPYTVNDYSFTFKADIEYDSDNLSHILFLTLMKGSRDESYTVSYTVDGGHSVKLTDISGRELGASFTETFKDATVRSYDLSRAEKGEHLMKMTISTDDYTQELEIPYEVVALPFSVHLETDTSGSDATAVLLTLKEGDTATVYETEITIDGEKFGNTLKVNFSQNPIFRITLPTIRPGQHDIKATLTDGYTQEEASENFSEPVRHPYILISLGHEESSGRHTATVGDNPYGIELKFKTSLTLTGVSTYCVSTYEYYSSDFVYKQKTKTMSDSSTSEDSFDNQKVTLIDRDALATKMTGSYEMSNVLTYYEDPADGENSGFEWWEKTGTERAYYQIKGEDLNIEITGEKVTGVTLKVTNNIGKMTLNGKVSSSGLTQINL